MGGDWQRLYRVHAGPQHGAVTVRQAVECGIPIRTFHNHVRMHGWQHLHRGVWATPGSADSYARSAAAALLTASGRGLLTGVSVLHMLGALRRRPGRVDLLVPPAHHMAALDGVRHFRGRWVAGDKDKAMQIEGMRAVPAVRALTDYAADHRQPEIERAIAELDRLRVAKPDDVAAYLARRGLFPGRGRIRSALDAVSGELTHSGAERDGRRLLSEARLGSSIRFGVDEIEQSPQAFVRQVAAGLQAAMSRSEQPWPV